MRSVRFSLIAVMLLAVLTPLDHAADMSNKPKPKQKLTKWIPLMDAALLQARKEKKCILAYFTGSDWAPFSQKLEKDVLNTDMFRNWAADNVILFLSGLPKEKSMSGNIKTQNDQLKQKFCYQSPDAFILMDWSGLPFMRESNT